MGFSIVGISYWNLCLISTNRNLAMYDPKLGKAISFSYLCIAFSLGSRIGDMALLDEPIVELSAKVCACYSVFGV